ncbi:MAG: hypothetical protein ACPG3W_11940 [Synechococcus sp.]
MSMTACLPDLLNRVKALADRIEALESAQPNYPEKPDSSLVARVALAITGENGGPINWRPEARAAIREVAAWLSEHYGGPTETSHLLEQEAER